jgi:ribosomal protein S18 acetylase RimI-like enzyme
MCAGKKRGIDVGAALAAKQYMQYMKTIAAKAAPTGEFVPMNDSGSKNVDIGFATADDLPQLADLLAELFTLESDFRPERDRQLRGLHLILDNPALGRLFVLRIGAKVLGMANALITVSTAEGGRVLVLEDVIVGSEYRGRGQGRMLVQHVLAWAKAEGMVRVTLLADSDNTAALDFYGKLDFCQSNMRVLRKSLI